MKKVIVLGSLNMDLTICADRMPQQGETMNGYDFFINPGGKGANQAVAAAKLDAQTYMIGNVGMDMFGGLLLDALKEYGVHAEEVCQEEHVASGVAMVLRSEGDNRIILGNGANHTLRIQNAKQAMDRLVNPEDIFLTQLENSYEVVKEALLYAKQKKMYTILNPAPARALDDQIYAAVDMLVVNQSECEMLSGIYPKDLESYEKAIAYFETKKVQVIITLGKEGSVFKENGETILISSPNVKTVDSTAAGDSYIGALCAELSKGSSLHEALMFASDVAALCVTRKGAQVSIPYRQEVYDTFHNKYKGEGK